MTLDLDAYRFTNTHEWVHIIDKTARIGISEHAQSQLGDVIFVDTPTVGTTVKAGQRLGVVESVKAASDIYAPIAGTVSAVNLVLNTTPEVINTDPYEAGWIVELSPFDDTTSVLLTYENYEKSV